MNERRKKSAGKAAYLSAMAHISRRALDIDGGIDLCFELGDRPAGLFARVDFRQYLSPVLCGFRCGNQPGDDWFFGGDGQYAGAACRPAGYLLRPAGQDRHLCLPEYGIDGTPRGGTQDLAATGGFISGTHAGGARKDCGERGLPSESRRTAAPRAARAGAD